MADVAARAGVSQATVSLVLNAVEDSRIGAATRNKVLKAAEELQYRRGIVTPHLAGKNKVIGMVIDELSANWVAPALIDDVRDICWEMGADLMLCSTRGQPDLEEVAIRRLLLHAPIGMIYASLFPRRIVVPGLLSGINTVLMNCVDGQQAFPAIMPDFESATSVTLEHLHALGHTRIALLNHESWHLFAQYRLRSYKAFLKRQGMAFDRSIVHHINGAPDEGYRMTLQMLQAPHPPSAILCANDRMAFGAYDAIRECGLVVGKDVSIVGFDDHDLSKFLHPGLTTVRMPHAEMARKAVETLFSVHEGLIPQKDVHHIEGELILRDSSAPPP